MKQILDKEKEEGRQPPVPPSLHDQVPVKKVYDKPVLKRLGALKSVAGSGLPW